MAAFAAFLVFALAGCQYTSTSDVQKASTSWRVLERVGDVRMVAENGGIDVPLLPGEAIAADRQVRAAKGALLILAGDGIQLTAGENTSLRLSDPAALFGLFLDHGWLRVRLAAAANRGARIRTPHFDINASNGMLTLRTTPDETRLLVESGSAVLATNDGRHRATLTAGAAARIDQTAGSDLLIQQASGQAFTKVSPLPAETQRRDSGSISNGPKGQRNGLIEDKETPTEAPPKKASERAVDRNVAIRPASQKRQDRRSSPTTQRQIRTTDVPPGSPSLPPTSAMFSVKESLSSKPDLVRSTKPADMVDNHQSDPVVQQTSTLDPVQLRFDRLTEGLLDGL